MRVIAIGLLLSISHVPVIFAQRLSIKPPTITILEGESEEFTILLSSEPAGDVTVTILSSDGTEVSLDRTVLKFTSVNWNLPQTVRLLAAEDNDPADYQGSLILIASGSGLEEGGITISPDTTIINSLGDTIQLTAIIRDQDGETVDGATLKWSSANPSIATVGSNGKVTAVGSGEATITATLATASRTATILVDDLHITDKQILEVLFKATGGEEWTNRDDWLTGHLNYWYGVDTDPGHHGRVVSLWLDENNLVGTLPASLGRLKSLRTLYLSYNSLTNEIPPELSKLRKLNSLDLSDNKLSGKIPPELANLGNLERLYLSGNELSGTIPPELSKLRKLNSLYLEDNELSGTIPPELANLGNLENLGLRFNSLTGAIPSELGNLMSLKVLNLSNNGGLIGLLPRSFLNLSPFQIDINGTGICWQHDAVFLEWWNSVPRTRAENCTSEQIERLALMELYDQTNGTLWVNSAGWGSDDPIRNWHGITVENGRITKLSLPNNALTGSIPSEIVNLTELKILNLHDNSLTGTLPEEILFLSDLTELRVNGNMDLQGVLNNDLMRLTKLEVLHFSNTSLCASPHPTFQAWYERIDDVSGMVCGNPSEVKLDMPIAYLTQSVQTPSSSVRLIEGRDALLRVFVTGESISPAFFEYKVIATVREGEKIHRVKMTRPGEWLASTIDQSELNNSFNTVIPGHLITPKSTLVVEVDPDGIIPHAAGSHDRFPIKGEATLNVVSVPDMEVVVVPILEANWPDSSVFAWTDNISDNSPEVGLLKYAFPFYKFHARSRESYVTSLNLASEDGQIGLLAELEVLRLLDNATGHYYGAAASVFGYVRGRAQMGGWVAMGKAWDKELAHEIGHNLNLAHAPCGGAPNIDLHYPHTGGSVGAWGFDFRDGTMISPNFYKDIMGYCYDQEWVWISDYYFEKVINYREHVESASGRSIAENIHEFDNVLVLWGNTQDGELQINPPFSVTARSQLPEQGGPYHLDGFGQNGIMFSLSFTPKEDKFGNKYFFFAIPIEQEWKESLERIILTGPQVSKTLDTNDQRTLSIFWDDHTGQVRGILRDWNGNLPTVLGPASDLNITTIQGLRESIR